MKSQNRTVRLSILLPLILLTGCESFTLIGSVDIVLGSEGEVVGGKDDHAVDNADTAAEPCWPDAAAMRAEIRGHGYDPVKWPATADWFERLAKLREALPECE